MCEFHFEARKEAEYLNVILTKLYRYIFAINFNKHVNYVNKFG